MAPRRVGTLRFPFEGVGDVFAGFRREAVERYLLSIELSYRDGFGEFSFEKRSPGPLVRALARMTQIPGNAEVNPADLGPLLGVDDRRRSRILADLTESKILRWTLEGRSVREESFRRVHGAPQALRRPRPHAGREVARHKVPPVPVERSARLPARFRPACRASGELYPPGLPGGVFMARSVFSECHDIREERRPVSGPIAAWDWRAPAVHRLARGCVHVADGPALAIFRDADVDEDGARLSRPPFDEIDLPTGRHDEIGILHEPPVHVVGMEDFDCHAGATHEMRERGGEGVALRDDDAAGVQWVEAGGRGQTHGGGMDRRHHGSLVAFPWLRGFQDGGAPRPSRADRGDDAVRIVAFRQRELHEDAVDGRVHVPAADDGFEFVVGRGRGKRPDLRSHADLRGGFSFMPT